MNAGGSQQRASSTTTENKRALDVAKLSKGDGGRDFNGPGNLTGRIEFNNGPSAHGIHGVNNVSLGPVSGA